MGRLESMSEAFPEDRVIKGASRLKRLWNWGKPKEMDPNYIIPMYRLFGPKRKRRF